MLLSVGVRGAVRAVGHAGPHALAHAGVRSSKIAGSATRSQGRVEGGRGVARKNKRCVSETQFPLLHFGDAQQLIKCEMLGTNQTSSQSLLALRKKVRKTVILEKNKYKSKGRNSDKNQ